MRLSRQPDSLLKGLSNMAAQLLLHLAALLARRRSDFQRQVTCRGTSSLSLMLSATSPSTQEHSSSHKHRAAYVMTLKSKQLPPALTQPHSKHNPVCTCLGFTQDFEEPTVMLNAECACSSFESPSIEDISHNPYCQRPGYNVYTLSSYLIFLNYLLSLTGSMTHSLFC